MKFPSTLSIMLTAAPLSVTSQNTLTTRSSIEATLPLMLSPPETVKAIGAQQWEKLSSNGIDKTPHSCWNVALNRFRQLSFKCDSSNEVTKTLLALTLTQCHFIYRPKGAFPDEESQCSLTKAFVLYNEAQDLQETRNNNESSGSFAITKQELERMLQSCLANMSDSAFEVYIQFFNHVDNICYFLHSSIWQEKTEDMVNRLASVSQETVAKLDQVQRQHSLLLEQQQEALKRQHNLLIGSQRIEEALDSGHSHLQSVFSDMRNEVQKEQKRLLSMFDDTFDLISKVLQLQQNVMGRLTDFETVLTYAGLVVLTFYLTAADSTRGVRGRLYALWTVMLLIEVLTWRVHYYIEVSWEYQLSDPNAVRRLMRCWRLFCISVALVQWMLSWWKYRDSTSVIVNALHDGLKDLKEQLTSCSTTTVADISNMEPSMIYRGAIASYKGRRISDTFALDEYHDIFDTLDEHEEQLLDPDYLHDHVNNESDEQSSNENAKDSSTEEDDDELSLASGDLSVIRKVDVKSDYDAFDVAEDVNNWFTSRGLFHREPRSSLDKRSHTVGALGDLHKRRTNIRQCRPVVLRAPIPGCPEDVKYLNLNPILLFETENDFVDSIYNSIEKRKLERLNGHLSISNMQSLRWKNKDISGVSDHYKDKFSTSKNYRSDFPMWIEPSILNEQEVPENQAMFELKSNQNKHELSPHDCRSLETLNETPYDVLSLQHDSESCLTCSEPRILGRQRIPDSVQLSVNDLWSQDQNHDDDDRHHHQTSSIIDVNRNKSSLYSDEYTVSIENNKWSPKDGVSSPLCIGASQVTTCQEMQVNSSTSFKNLSKNIQKTTSDQIRTSHRSSNPLSKIDTASTEVCVENHSSINSQEKEPCGENKERQEAKSHDKPSRQQRPQRRVITYSSQTPGISISKNSTANLNSQYQVGLKEPHSPANSRAAETEKTKRTAKSSPARRGKSKAKPKAIAKGVTTLSLPEIPLSSDDEIIINPPSERPPLPKRASRKAKLIKQEPLEASTPKSTPRRVRKTPLAQNIEVDNTETNKRGGSLRTRRRSPVASTRSETPKSVT